MSAISRGDDPNLIFGKELGDDKWRKMLEHHRRDDPNPPDAAERARQRAAAVELFSKAQAEKTAQSDVLGAGRVMSQTTVAVPVQEPAPFVIPADASMPEVDVLNTARTPTPNTLKANAQHSAPVTKPISSDVVRRLKIATATTPSNPQPAKGADLGTLSDLEGHAKRNRLEKPAKAHRRRVNGSDPDYELALAKIRARHNSGSDPAAPVDPEAGSKRLAEAVEQAHQIRNAMSEMVGFFHEHIPNALTQQDSYNDHMEEMHRDLKAAMAIEEPEPIKSFPSAMDTTTPKEPAPVAPAPAAPVQAVPETQKSGAPAPPGRLVPMDTVPQPATPAISPPASPPPPPPVIPVVHVPREAVAAFKPVRSKSPKGGDRLRRDHSCRQGATAATTTVLGNFERVCKAPNTGTKGDGTTTTPLGRAGTT